MDSSIDWEKLLKAKYPSYKVEVDVYLDSLEITTSTEISVSKIYESIKNDNDVPINLKLLYREALLGNNKDVKARIKNWVANFHRNHR